MVDDVCAGRQPTDDLAAQLKDHDGLRQEFRDALGGEGDDVVTSPVDIDAFAARLGIDISEEIPGTRPSADLAAEPDARMRLRAWLLEAERR